MEGKRRNHNGFIVCRQWCIQPFSITRWQNGDPKRADENAFGNQSTILLEFRPEVLRKWLLNHFRTRKKSNERTIDAIRETEGIGRDFRIMCLKIGSKKRVRVPFGTLDAPF
ncbi:uncharacterized protein LOC105431126 [Pogonomyrmex barbatus]|uniref:Uncharacterized protein LOC105431126 n=1 Tax=Pogonomyrmex barbatus TaxID=144034 RepID=A0A6I9XE84_9HYME|nr:uncharacterized protein LOC105431126 [Pogonomyrmex barbatus]